MGQETLTRVAHLPEVNADRVVSVVNLGVLVGRAGQTALGLCEAVVSGTVGVDPPARVVIEHGAATDEAKGGLILQAPPDALGQDGG